MRGAMIGVGVLVLAVGVGLYVMQARSGAGGGSARPVGATSEGADEAGAPTVPGLSAEARAALAQLEAELSEAEVVEYRSDEERLADARAWVAANRPADRPYNELEAQILALMDVLLDGKERSAEWAMNMSQIEIEMIRAIDADGDGQVTDEEVVYFIDENIAAMFNPMEHPYLQEKFDTNGDGETTPDELAALAGMIQQGALAGAFERGKLEAWDTDNDGYLSADERVAGEQAADNRVREIFGDMLSRMGEGQIDAWLGDPALSPEERDAARQEFYDQVGEQAAQMMESQRDMMLSQAAAQDFLNDMRVDNLPQPDMKEIMDSMPQPPGAMSFDADGDGSLSAEEQAAQQQGMLDYQQEVQRWGSELTAYRLQAQFENSITQSDGDGDGRLSPAEWDERITDLLYQREERLLLRSYDLDGSGRVEAAELVEYLDWYRAGSLRADFNYDGTLDARDLEAMSRAFQSQGG